LTFFIPPAFFLTVSPETIVELGKYCSEQNKILAWCVAAPFVAEFFLDRVNSVLPYVDYLVANETEAEMLIKQLKITDEGMEVKMKHLAELPKVNKKRPRTVIVTHGSEPVQIFQNGKLHSFPVTPIDKSLIVDTNGAGDAFLGGFLAGLMIDKPLEECVRAAMYASRYIMQVSGTQYNKKCDFEWN